MKFAHTWHSIILSRARVTAEEWLITKPGAYLPGVFEQVLFSLLEILLPDYAHFGISSSIID